VRQIKPGMLSVMLTDYWDQL